MKTNDNNVVHNIRIHGEPKPKTGKKAWALAQAKGIQKDKASGMSVPDLQTKYSYSRAQIYLYLSSSTENPIAACDKSGDEK